MAQDYAKPFYNSRAWIKCRDAFMASKNYVCEICGGLAVICHHVEPITPANIENPNVSLNWALLMAVCVECHNSLHGTSAVAEGLMFDAHGNLVNTPRGGKGRHNP